MSQPQQPPGIRGSIEEDSGLFLEDAAPQDDGRRFEIALADRRADAPTKTVLFDGVVDALAAVETLDLILRALGMKFPYHTIKRARVVVTETVTLTAVSYTLTVDDVVRAA